ncbi:hypothetical protein CPC08DRAFT_814161 [Agrocybe pediades]|nr:hypothetical protein CPC08DRAFT_814161 [Agrocybe pediades]
METDELEADIWDGEKVQVARQKEPDAKLWNVCSESGSLTLTAPGQSTQVRIWHTECALAANDVESAVGDMASLSYLLQTFTVLCLHYDPDFNSCLSSTQGGPAGSCKLLLTKDDMKNGDLWQRWEDALIEQSGDEKELLPLIPPTLVQASMLVQASSTTTAKKSKKTAQTHLSLASKMSPQGQKLVRNQREKWCDELLTLDGCKEDVDGLVGRGETLLVKEEFEEAVRTSERAFEGSGRSDRDIFKDCSEHRNCSNKANKRITKFWTYPETLTRRPSRKLTKKPTQTKAVAKMASLNEAYEVLSNPELWQRFDNR